MPASHAFAGVKDLERLRQALKECTGVIEGKRVARAAQACAFVKVAGITTRDAWFNYKQSEHRAQEQMIQSDTNTTIIFVSDDQHDGCGALGWVEIAPCAARVFPRDVPAGNVTVVDFTPEQQQAVPLCVEKARDGANNKTLGKRKRKTWNWSPGHEKGKELQIRYLKPGADCIPDQLYCDVIQHLLEYGRFDRTRRDDAGMSDYATGGKKEIATTPSQKEQVVERFFADEFGWKAPLVDLTPL